MTVPPPLVKRAAFLATFWLCPASIKIRYRISNTLAPSLPCSDYRLSRWLVACCRPCVCAERIYKRLTWWLFPRCFLPIASPCTNLDGGDPLIGCGENRGGMLSCCQIPLDRVTRTGGDDFSCHREGNIPRGVSHGSSLDGGREN